jgi:hypothetical protein
LRSGAIAEDLGQKKRKEEVQGFARKGGEVYGKKHQMFFGDGTTSAKDRQPSTFLRRKCLRARNGRLERETERWLQLQP